MSADVVDTPYLTVIPAKKDDRIDIHLYGEVVAGGGDLARVTGEEPATPPDTLYVQADERAFDNYTGHSAWMSQPTGRLPEMNYDLIRFNRSASKNAGAILRSLRRAGDIFAVRFTGNGGREKCGDSRVRSLLCFRAGSG